MMKFSALLALCSAAASMSIVTNKPASPADKFSIQAAHPGNLSAVQESEGLAQPHLAVQPRADRLDDATEMRLDTLFSTLSPIRVDCFHVTTARLLGVSLQTFEQHTGIPVPARGTGGISGPAMVQALQRLGWVAEVWKSGAAGVTEAVAHRRFANMPASQRPDKVGVAYRRRDGSGHVVFCKNPGKIPYTKYTDYQASTKGVDVSEEVRKSTIFAVFGPPKLGNGAAPMDIDSEGDPMDVDPRV